MIRSSFLFYNDIRCFEFNLLYFPSTVHHNLEVFKTLCQKCNPDYQKITYNKVRITIIPSVARLNTGSWTLNTPGGSSQL